MTGLRIDIDTQGVAELAAQWERSPAIVEAELKRAMTEATLLLERETKELTPVGVGGGGGLRGSITARGPRIVERAVIGEVGSPLDYAEPVELGSRPHRPPVEPIEDWVRFKLGIPAPESRRVAFAIAAKIARRGTKGAFMFKRAFEANVGQVQRMFVAARARIAERLAGP